jgi:hypothetical protein
MVCSTKKLKLKLFTQTSLDKRRVIWVSLDRFYQQYANNREQQYRERS